jgi:hypothetical protein
MGTSTRFCLPTFLCAALAAQAPAPTVRDASLRPPAAPLAELVLASCDPEPRIREFGLGDGGVPVGEAGRLRWDGDDVVTAGGVRVVCRGVGVKLEFPSGREVLIAPDGFVHLRSGERAGPFATGIELLLADGESVRIALQPSADKRLRDVIVGGRDRWLQPWRRGGPAAEVARHGGWAGVRFVCAGDGGDLYRVIALGPLLVLERALVAADRVDAAPEQRLVVLANPLVESLHVMKRQHRETDALVRRALTAVASVADRADVLFPVGRALARAERDRLRWLLVGGFELELELAGRMAPRLQLYAGGSPLPMVEWTLRADAAAFMANPRTDQAEKPWHGNGTRLPRVVPHLQAREELFERGHALRVIERLRR